MTEKTVAVLAYKRVREDLLKGRISPSSRLRLNDLQQRYDLGLSPLREALLRLASDGLVTVEGQRGFAAASVSLSELADLTRTRQQIESIALTQAISNGSATWEAEILSTFHLLSRTPMPKNREDEEAMDLWERKHRAFHDALIGGCESPWLMRIHSQLVDHSERYRMARLFGQGPEMLAARDTEAEHRAIMEAVLARNTPLACELMAEHLQKTERAAARAIQMAGATNTH